MIKLFIYIPLHLFNLWLSLLSPNWIFKKAYTPSSDAIREQENIVKNKIRRANYYTKRMIQR